MPIILIEIEIKAFLIFFLKFQRNLIDLKIILRYFVTWDTFHESKKLKLQVKIFLQETNIFILKYKFLGCFKKIKSLCEKTSCHG
jgi:hypothetical protein